MDTLTLVNTGLAGFFAFAAIHYAVAWSLSRREAVLLVFSVQCGLYAGFCLAISAFFHATTVAGSQTAHDRFFTIGVIIHAVVLESYARLGDRRARAYRVLVSGTLIGLAVLNQSAPVRGTILELRRMPLPWGGMGLLPIRRPPGLACALTYVAATAVQAYGLWIARAIWKRDRAGAVLIVAGAMMVMAGSAVGFLIDFAKLRAPYAGALPHAFYVLCMALYLAREYAARGARLAASQRGAERSPQEAREPMAHLRAEQQRRDEAEAARGYAMEALAEALVRSQRKELASQLAAGVAHDFNNVVALMSLWSGLLLRDSVPPALRENARLALSNGRTQGEALSRRLVALARSEPRSVKRFPLDRPVRTTVQTLTAALPRGIELTFEADAAPEVQGDEAEIEQVIYNLVLNARDAMPGGGAIQVTAGLVNSPTPLAVAGGALAAGSWAMLRVTDSGPGVDPTIRERIFDLFFSTKEPEKGTGIGLASAARIARTHGGGIALENASEEGSTFTVYLPCG